MSNELPLHLEDVSQLIETNPVITLGQLNQYDAKVIKWNNKPLYILIDGFVDGLVTKKGTKKLAVKVDPRVAEQLNTISTYLRHSGEEQLHTMKDATFTNDDGEDVLLVRIPVSKETGYSPVDLYRIEGDDYIQIVEKVNDTKWPKRYIGYLAIKMETVYYKLEEEVKSSVMRTIQKTKLKKKLINTSINWIVDEIVIVEEIKKSVKMKKKDPVIKQMLPELSPAMKELQRRNQETNERDVPEEEFLW